MPVRRYNVVHAGAKSQPGGLKKGLLRASYQAEAVKKEPITPAIWHITIEARSFQIFIVCKIFCIIKIFGLFYIIIYQSFNNSKRFYL